MYLDLHGVCFLTLERDLGRRLVASMWSAAPRAGAGAVGGRCAGPPRRLLLDRERDLDRRLVAAMWSAASRAGAGAVGGRGAGREGGVGVGVYLSLSSWVMRFATRLAPCSYLEVMVRTTTVGGAESVCAGRGGGFVSGLCVGDDLMAGARLGTVTGLTFAG